MKGTIQSHGSMPFSDLRALQIEPLSVIDFSATVNPFPLPQAVRALFTGDGIAAYPDTECHDARNALADFHQIPLQWTLVSAGVTEIIYALPLLYRRAACFSPSYGDYAAAYRRCRRTVAAIPFPETGREFRTAVSNMKQISFQAIIICNPNNPTGDYLPICRIEELCRRFSHAVVCIDESYQEMGEQCETAIPLLSRFRNLLVLKSLTKPYGIGGLRAGYAVSSGESLKLIRQFLMPWGVSSIAQRIIPSLTGCRAVFRKQWADILKQKKAMMQALEKQGHPVASGRCPFFLVRTGNAEETRMRLLREHRIAVRGCASFGMPEWVRIMPGRPEHNRQLLDKLKYGVE